MNDEALAIAVKELIGGGAAQPRAHRPDMRLDDAMAELVVEGRDRELRQNVGEIVGGHQEVSSLGRRACYRRKSEAAGRVAAVGREPAYNRRPLRASLRI